MTEKQGGSPTRDEAEGERQAREEEEEELDFDVAADPEKGAVKEAHEIAGGKPSPG